MLSIILLISLEASSFKVFAGDYTSPIEGLTINKIATPYGTPDADGRQIFKLDITATTESNIIVTSKPCDIILVLDDSGSMDDTLSTTENYTAITDSPNTSWTYYVHVNGQYMQATYRYSVHRWRYRINNVNYYVTWDPAGDDEAVGSTNSSTPTAKPFYIRTTKLHALKTAANAFVQTVYAQSPSSRIAVVSFESNAENLTGGLVSVDSGGAINNDIIDAINSLNGNGATHSNEGLGMAADIFQADTQTGRNRVVIMFTDGEPGDYGFENNDGSRYAAAAINQAAIIKGQRGTYVNSNVTFNNFQAGIYIDPPRIAVNEPGCGAMQYCIGIFPADVNVLAHHYMAWVSSDNDSSQTATSSDGYEYYFTADSAEGLNNIFQSIAEETGQTLEDVVIKDYIDPRFDIVDENGNILNVDDIFTAEGQTGTIMQDANGIYIQWNQEKIEPGTIEDGKGFKAAVYVKPKEDFVGGNVVPTNIPNISAIYIGNENIGSLPSPTVNIPFKLNVSNIEDDIFLGENILRDQTTAQNDMLFQSMNYAYPSGLLTYLWNPEFTADLKPENTTSFNLTVTANSIDYIDFSDTSIWTPLNDGSTLIGYTKTSGEVYYLPVGTEAVQVTDSADYTVNVKKGTLTIIKSIDGTANPNQTFLFEIKQYSDTDKTLLLKTFYETIRVSDNSNNRIIVYLPKGCYEITEKSDWSWQYSLNSTSNVTDTLGMNADGTRNIDKNTAQASFSNEPEAIKCLNSIDWNLYTFSGVIGNE
jgi:hypothetical protein